MFYIFFWSIGVNMDIIEVFVFVIYIFIVMDVNGCIVIEEENLVEV